MPVPADQPQGVTLHIIAESTPLAAASLRQAHASTNPLLDHPALDNAVRHASVGDQLLVMDPRLAAGLAATDPALRNKTLGCFAQVYLHVATGRQRAQVGSETTGPAEPVPADLHSADDTLFVTLVTATARSITW